MIVKRAAVAIDRSSVLRSDRTSAFLLLGAAVIGLLLANLPFGPELVAFKTAHLEIPALGLDLSIGHWISDGLLAIFFFVVAIELKHELTVGQLSSVSKAIVPAIGALGGVIAPALIYLAIAGSSAPTGWPIPTATDIAFALGVFAVFGKGLPSQLRIYLLALAVLDDLIAILIIAIFFTTEVNLLALGGALVLVVIFGVLSAVIRRLNSRGAQFAVGALMIVVGVVTWYLVYQSGVHATIAGVLLGFAMTRSSGHVTGEKITPYSNAVVLPIFALSAAMVAIPQVGLGELQPAFWAITVALPFGKIIGIMLFGTVAHLATRSRSEASVSGLNLFTVSTVAGIGFTVSLLMNELAFEGNELVIEEGTLAVLLGSAIAIVISGITVSLRARHYRTRLAERDKDEVTQP